MVRHTEPGAAVSNNCGGYEVLLDELAVVIRHGDEADVESFLRAHPDREDELRSMLPTIRAMAVLGDAEATSDSPVDMKCGANPILGDFRIIREIGRGGMGVVYEAEQISLPRRVALKVLPFAGMLDPRQLERFRNESRAAATLDHPGIVSVYSVGCVRAVHFYALQYVEGQSLAEVITQLRGEREVTAEASRMSQLTRDFVSGSTNGEATKKTVKQAAGSTMRSATAGSTSSTPLGTVGTIESRAFMQSVARLGIQVAEALDHAHTRGIVHRDIKPGNLLLDTEGNVKVADFGLARFEADAGVTMTGDIVGTLRYMSPEQALAKRVVVDHRTDIYSLGVTLYELLTLRPPFSGSDRSILLRQIAFDEPAAPRKLNRAIPRELETIVMTAIAKDPSDRYATAEALAEDLQRFLDKKPIRARRVSRVEHTWRWAKRNPLTSALASLLIIVITISSIVGWGYARKLRVALSRTEELRAAADERLDKLAAANDQSQRMLYATSMRLARENLDDGKLATVETLLGSYETGEHRQLRDFIWFHLKRRVTTTSDISLRSALGGDLPDVYTLRYSSDGRHILGGLGNGCLLCWDAATGQYERKVRAHDVCLNMIAVASNSDLIATASCDGTAKLWSWPELNLIQTFRNRDEPLRCVDLSPSGTAMVAGCDDGGVYLWQCETGEYLGEIAHHDPEVNDVAFSPDGLQIASVGNDSTLQVVDRENVGQVTSIRLPSRGQTVAYRPDGVQLVVGDERGFSLYTSSDPSVVVNRTAWEAPVEVARWTADSQKLVIGDRRGTVFLKHLDNSSIRFTPPSDRVFSLCFSPDGRQLTIATARGRARIFNTDHVFDAFDRHSAAVVEIGRATHITIAPAANLAIAVTNTGQMVLRAQLDSTLVSRLEFGIDASSITGLLASSNARVLATNDAEKGRYNVWQYDPTKQAMVHLWGSIGEAVCISPDGSVCVVVDTTSEPPEVKLVDSKTGSTLTALGNRYGSPCRAVFSEDGKVLAVATETIAIWEHRPESLFAYRATIPCKPVGSGLAISSHGSLVAVSLPSRRVEIFETTSGTRTGSLDTVRATLQSLEGSSGGIKAMSLAPNGQSLAIASKWYVTVWDLYTGAEILALPCGLRVGEIEYVAFCDDGNSLVAWRSAIEESSIPARVWRWSGRH